MLKSVYRSSFTLFLAIVLGACVAPFAIGSSQGGQQSTDKRKEKEEKKKGGLTKLNPFGKGKEEKKETAEADAEKPTKQEREYQKIKQFSDKLYAEDSGFHDEVEETYRQKQREHSEYAFFINTRDNQDEQIMRTGDKLKVDDTLYDNPLVQDYVNRVGQSIVPGDSVKLYAFKVTLNPIPEARSLSTGTIYISSGLLSIIDNEAQLAYILGHEVAHVEKNHWHQDVLVERGMQRYNEKQQQKRQVIGGIASLGLGVVTGGITGSFGKAGLAALYAELALPTILKLAIPNAVASWDKAQEDEADQLGLKYMFDRKYDPREVPKFYAALQRTSQRDSRASLGFMADAARVVERAQQVSGLIGGFGNLSSTGLYVGALNLKMQREMQVSMASIQQSVQQQTGAGKEPDKGKTINAERDAAGRAAAASQTIASGPMSAEIKAKLDAGELIGSSAEFAAVMAELKRDNGVRAYYYDMFQMARDNLEESLMIRSNDPFAHLYYGKVLKLTARTTTEKQRALFEFVKAIELDKRRVLAEPHLYRSLAMIETKDPAREREIVSSLQDYVAIYQREHGGNLPPNMDVIYDYLQEVGEMTWAARPAMNISTKNIDPIGIQGGSQVSAPSQLSTPITVPAVTPKSRKP
ncbi:MAG: Beta-barrel assembly-enhancing protease [Acidobacteria bacterium]|nr:Beta-barrel assembly-enhancing protease [Acidobacteriota bacterium]